LQSCSRSSQPSSSLQDDVQSLQQLMPDNVAAGAQLAQIAHGTTHSPLATASARSATPSSSLPWSPGALAPPSSALPSSLPEKGPANEAAALRRQLEEAHVEVGKQIHTISTLKACLLLLSAGCGDCCALDEAVRCCEPRPREACSELILSTENLQIMLN
jgi:hypothetical protein